jgi:hypothetical protein
LVLAVREIQTSAVALAPMDRLALSAPSPLVGAVVVVRSTVLQVLLAGLVAVALTLGLSARPVVLALPRKDRRAGLTI